MDQKTATYLMQEISAISATQTLNCCGKVQKADVDYKTTGEIVTSADLTIQHLLSELLAKLYPGSLVLGEELVSKTSHDFVELERYARAWIIDPIDGTANFARGYPFFCTMVSSVEYGSVTGAWICAPALRITAYAANGIPSTFDGDLSSLNAGSLGAADFVMTHPDFWLESDKRLFSQLQQKLQLRPSRCAGIEYLAVAAGLTRGLIFTWDKPWDHVAGLFLLGATGGAHRCADGTCYSPKGNNSLPLVAARHPIDIKHVFQNIERL